jgi:hypothetical protein
MERKRYEGVSVPSGLGLPKDRNLTISVIGDPSKGLTPQWSNRTSAVGAWEPVQISRLTITCPVSRFFGH